MAKLDKDPLYKLHKLITQVFTNDLEEAVRGKKELSAVYMGVIIKFLKDNDIQALDDIRALDTLRKEYKESGGVLDFATVKDTIDKARVKVEAEEKDRLEGLL